MMFVAGDDVNRKTVVLALVADLGFDARDGGHFSRAVLLEPYALIWIEQAILQGAARDSVFAFIRKDGQR